MASIKTLAATVMHNSTVTSTIHIMRGLGTAQILAFAVTPLLTRIFTPEDFGQFAAYVSLVTVLSSAASGGFELAIPLSRTSHEADVSLRLSFVVLGLTTALIAGTVAVSSQFPSSRASLGSPRLWLFLPAGVAAVTGWRILSYNQTWLGDFVRIGYSHIVRAAITAISQIGLGVILGIGPVPLILGFILGQSASLIVILRRRPDHSVQSAIAATPRELISAARKHIDFLRYGSVQALVNSMSQNVTILLLAHFFSNGVVGFVALAVRIITVPVNLIANSFRQVTYRRLASAPTPRERYASWKRSTTVLALLSAGPCIVCILVGPWFFTFFLGHQWEASGDFARLLVIPTMLAIVNPPSVMAVPILGLQRIHMLYEIILLAARSAAILLGGFLQDPFTAILLFAIAGVLCNAWLILFVGHQLRRAACPEENLAPEVNVQ
jgi:lipopolysaccharide exporter